jgi:hypothetical protein
MADYPISKEAVQKMLVDLRTSLNERYISIGISMALHQLEGFPQMDAVPVVRCKDCIFRGQHDLCPMCVSVYMLDEAAYLDCTEDDGFCHKGANLDLKEE